MGAVAHWAIVVPALGMLWVPPPVTDSAVGALQLD